MQQKLVPDPFLILLHNPKQPLHARKLLKIIYPERSLSKSFNKLTFFFLKPFNGQDYEKQKGPGNDDQSLFRLQTS